MGLAAIGNLTGRCYLRPIVDIWLSYHLLSSFSLCKLLDRDQSSTGSLPTEFSFRDCVEGTDTDPCGTEESDSDERVDVEVNNKIQHLSLHCFKT